MKKFKQIFAVLLLVTFISTNTVIAFAADDDLPVPRIVFQSVIEEQ